MSQGSGLAAIVPVFNEAPTLERVVQGLRRQPQVRQVVLVDDGSTDGSRRIAEELARHPEVDALFHSTNRGKGAAVRSGLGLVREELVVIQDADAEYDPRDLARLGAALGPATRVVYGSRFMNGRPRGMGRAHRWGNRALTAFYNRLYGRRLSDLETGYKLMPTALLARLGIDHDGFELDPELSAKIARSGEMIAEVAVSYRGRSAAQGKKLVPADGLRALCVLWRYRRWSPALAEARPP